MDILKGEILIRKNTLIGRRINKDIYDLKSVYDIKPNDVFEVILLDPDFIIQYKNNLAEENDMMLIFGGVL